LPSSHASIVENMKLLEEEGVAIEPLPIKDYRVDADALAKMIRPETVLVSMDAVCGETGVVWNTREVAEVLKKTRRGETIFFTSGCSASSEWKKRFPSARLHVDVSQAPWTEKITRDHFGADLLTFDASKVGALHGCGALIVHRTIPIAPLYKGGGQERSLRSGTEAPELAQIFAASLGDAARDRDTFRAFAARDRAQLVKLIKKAIPNVYIQEGRTQAPNILNLSLVGRDTDYLVALLDEAGFAVSTRSACETDSETGSRAVFALTGDSERARATLRISWNPDVSSRELARFAKALIQAVAFIDSSGQR
jgi:cysteine desulfurase